jgi:5'-3' exonuclease
VAFKLASANQETYRWDDDTTSVFVQDLDDVKPKVDELLLSYKEALKADDMIVCLSCPHEENFRLGILPSYKGNRDYANRPQLLGPVKRYLAEAYRTYERPTLEADDVMGILSTHPRLIPGKKIIVSEDKDMKTIPGWLYNPRKDYSARHISEDAADYWHLYQTLIGDATDHYSGCPGVGPDTATTILNGAIGRVMYEHVFQRGPRKGTVERRYREETFDCMWRAIVSWYESKELTEEDALVQARVARICRASDYDFKNKEVKLWTPTDARN